MSLDPTLAAAIVTQAGGILAKLVEGVIGRSATGDARKVMERVFDQLVPEVTDSCVRVLLLLEGGGRQHIHKLRRAIHPIIDKEPQAVRDAVDRECSFRLKFLALLGLVRPCPGEEWMMSHLGGAFLTLARERHTHDEVLFPPP